MAYRTKSIGVRRRHVRTRSLFSFAFGGPLYREGPSSGASLATLDIIAKVTMEVNLILVLEITLLLLCLWLLFHRSYRPEPLELTEQEQEELITEWNPEPLVPDVDPNHYSLNTRIVSSKLGKHLTVDGRECLNLATHNYLGLTQNKLMEEAAIKALRKYGVGSCGPRGFYGTVDIHLELEARLAKFMNCEEAVLYSYGFSAVASAIPAYSKSGDVIFCDEGVHFAIQKGLCASRSKIKFFKHNDVQHLHRLLEEQSAEDKKNPKKAKVTRRFLVVEGLYLNYGDICPLKELIELKNRYKVRIFVDETVSFGVLGKSGRGITEHFDIPIDEIDHISATLEHATSAFGGFCCGTTFIVDHQRLSGLGYCFSASLPPLQAAVALAALDSIESDPTLIERLRNNCELMHDELEKISSLVVSGSRVSPVKHLAFANSSLTREENVKRLENVCDLAWEKNFAMTVARYLIDQEVVCPPPTIRLIVNSSLETNEIKQIGAMLRETFEAVS